MLLAYYNVIPPHISRWWPVIIIALGALLLLRHYWLLLFDRGPDLDRHSPIPILESPTRSFAPPLAPFIIAAIGLFLLLRNLHYVSLGVLLAIVLIVLGLAILSGSELSGFGRRGG